VDGPIHAASAKQRLVGGVHDGIDIELCDVTFDDLDRGTHAELHAERLRKSSSPKQERPAVVPASPKPN
jgi:hypothetical protein